MLIRIFRMSICTVAFAYQCPIVLAFQYYSRRNACLWALELLFWLQGLVTTLHFHLVALPLQDPWKCEPYCSPLRARPAYVRFRQCPEEGCVLQLFSWCLLDFPNRFWWDHCTSFPRTQTPQLVFRPTCCMAFWTWTSLWILPVMRPRDDNPQDIGATGIRAALKSYPDLKPEETDQQKPIDRIRLLLLILASSWKNLLSCFFSLPTIMSHNKVTDLLLINTGCLGLVACFVFYF